MSVTPEIPPDLEALRLEAVASDPPSLPVGRAARRLRSREGRAAVTREIAAIVQTFDTPYASGVERYFITLDDGAGEVIDLGRPYRGSHIFPTHALRKNIQVYRDFMAFAATQDTRTWRFWNVGLPNTTAPVHLLSEELKRFNKALNQELSELRKRKWVEVLLLCIHLRYDPQTGMFDLHAHLICHVPKETHDLASSRFFHKFSKIEAKDQLIRNLEAAVTYMLWGIIDPEKLLTWPHTAVKAVWDVTTAKARLTRTGGRFAKWRRDAREERRDPAAQEARRRKAENRAATAYEGARLPSGDRVVARLNLTLNGEAREGVLIERGAPSAMPSPPPETTFGEAPVSVEPAPLMGTTYPSATVATTQEPPEQRVEGRRLVEGRVTPTRRPQAWWWRTWGYGMGGTPSMPRDPAPIRRRLAACSWPPRAVRRARTLARQGRHPSSPS